VRSSTTTAAVARRLCLATVVAAALSGCSARAPARSATNGVLDALEQPEPNHPLARDLHALLAAYVAQARTAGTPKSPAEAARDVTGAVVDGVAEGAEKNRAALRALVEDVTRSAIHSALAELEGRPPRRDPAGADPPLGADPPPERPVERAAAPAPLLSDAGAERAGAALVRGATAAFLEELETQLGEDAQGPLGKAIASTTALTASAALRGAGAELDAAIAACRPGDPTCASDLFVRRLARAAAAGATEGVGHRIDPWPVVVAASGGLLLGALAAWLVARRPARASLR
jgi:hypothetical protein